MDGNTDYESELEKYNDNLEEAIEAVCPIKGGGDEKRQFFIESICGCSGIGFDVEKFAREEKPDSENLEQSFDSQIPKIPSSQTQRYLEDEEYEENFDSQKKGLIMQTRREDGKGIHYVSRSIAQNMDYSDYDPNQSYPNDDQMMESGEMFLHNYFQINIGDSKLPFSS